MRCKDQKIKKPDCSTTKNALKSHKGRKENKIKNRSMKDLVMVDVGCWFDWVCKHPREKSVGEWVRAFAERINWGKRLLQEWEAPFHAAHIRGDIREKSAFCLLTFAPWGCVHPPYDAILPLSFIAHTRNSSLGLPACTEDQWFSRSLLNFQYRTERLLGPPASWTEQLLVWGQPLLNDLVCTVEASLISL